jgi:hypothetical protein
LAKGFNGLLQLGLHHSLLLNLLLHDLSSLHDCPLLGHVLLHGPKALVFLAMAYKLILDDGFNFTLEISMFIFYGFRFVCVGLDCVTVAVLMLKVVWCSSVACKHPHLVRWLPRWAL